MYILKIHILEVYGQTDINILHFYVESLMSSTQFRLLTFLINVSKICNILHNIYLKCLFLDVCIDSWVNYIFLL